VPTLGGGEERAGEEGERGGQAEPGQESAKHEEGAHFLARSLCRQVSTEAVHAVMKIKGGERGRGCP